jgi:predicted RNA polymerase sigma factor
MVRAISAPARRVIADDGTRDLLPHDRRHGLNDIHGELAAAVPSPIIQLNRAVAIGMAEGPEEALTIVDQLMHEPALKGYHLLPSVRGDLLHRLGRFEEARVAFERAAALASNTRERDLLTRRAADAADAPRGLGLT